MRKPRKTRILKYSWLRSQLLRARGVATVAEAAGLGRESLYKALAPGAKPRFDTIYRVLQAAGMQLSINVPAKPKRAKVKPRTPIKSPVAAPATRKAEKGR